MSFVTPPANARKVFCIGFNKTGTTTLRVTAAEHGMRVIWDEGAWAKTTRHEAFEVYVSQFGKPPPADHPAGRYFHQWQNCNFYADGERSRFDLIDRLFPGSYFILNTRSLYGWLTSRYNKRLRNHQDKWIRSQSRPKPSIEIMRQWITQREEYYREVLSYFDGRDDFSVLDIESDERVICAILQIAIGCPIRRLYKKNMCKKSDAYIHHPEMVEEALKAQNIPSSEWYRSLL